MFVQMIYKLCSMFSKLCDILIKVVTDFGTGEPVYIVDALDEYEEELRDKLISALVKFYRDKVNPKI